MTFSQFPNGSLTEWQMPFRSWVAVFGDIEGPVDPPVTPQKEEKSGGVANFLDDYEEYLEEEEGKPPWKERSYRELLEVIEILTMVGFFE